MSNFFTHDFVTHHWVVSAEQQLSGPSARKVGLVMGVLCAKTQNALNGLPEFMIRSRPGLLNHVEVTWSRVNDETCSRLHSPP